MTRLLRRGRELERTRLGVFLQHATAEQIETALAMQRAGDSRLFGELMVELQCATPAQIDEALLRQRAARGELGAEGLQLLDGAKERSQSAAQAIDDLVKTVEALKRR